METSYSKALTDEEIVELCQTNLVKHEHLFHHLFQRYQNLVWRLCYSFTHNQQDAEDLMQEVFFKVYRNLIKFEYRSSFKTWLCRITINTCQNELRHRSRRPQATEMTIDALVELLPTKTTPESALQGKLKREKLASTMAQLRPQEFQALQLKDLEERPYTEVAQILGIGLSAAKMRVKRARVAFQQAYA